MSFSNTRPQSAFPVGGFGTQDQVTVEEFKHILTAACDYALPSNKSKKYNRVRVLLTCWTEDDLSVKNEVERLRDTFQRGYHYNCVIDHIPAGRYQSPIQWMSRKLLDLGEGTDSNDLIVFYYGGHGRSARTPDEGPCVFLSGEWKTGQSGEEVFYAKGKLEFTYAKKVTLDAGPADVLYLLDCCYAATAGIGLGKELTAAYGINRLTPGPDPSSFITAIVQELNRAISDEHFLTAAQLYSKTLDKVRKESIPMHVGIVAGPQPRTSILLAPLGDNVAVSSPGHKKHDLHAMLHVRIRNGDSRTLAQLRQWLTTNQPAATGVSLEYAAPTFSSILVVFKIPIPVYYCLQAHPAICFMTFGSWPEQPQKQQQQQPSISPSEGP